LEEELVAYAEPDEPDTPPLIAKEANGRKFGGRTAESEPRKFSRSSFPCHAELRKL